MKLRGVDTISQAEVLAGREMFGRDEDVAPRGEDEFLPEELAGCGVATRDGRAVGTVRTVWEAGGAPLLILDPKDGKNEIYIPFNRAICTLIDVAAKRIVIEPPDGLLDLNEI